MLNRFLSPLKGLPPRLGLVLWLLAGVLWLLLRHDVVWLLGEVAGALVAALLVFGLARWLFRNWPMIRSVLAGLLACLVFGIHLLPDENLPEAVGNSRVTEKSADALPTKPPAGWASPTPTKDKPSHSPYAPPAASQERNESGLEKKP